MTEEEKKDFATGLILEHACDIEYMTIFEMADLWGLEEVSESDAEDVVGLIAQANITVSFKQEG